MRLQSSSTAARRRLGWSAVALAGAAAAVIVAPGCYGATEVSVVLTTNADCGAMTTQLYTGAPGTADLGTAPAAERVSCERAAEGRIGTLTIVPSGARDDRFDVEAVAAVGVPASSCQAMRTAAPRPLAAIPTATGCIVARRRISFRPHHSLTLPMNLSASCIGVVCGTDQTCDLGVCSSTAECTEEGCPRERAAAATPGVDAAAEAGDAAVDAASDAVADAPADAPFDAPAPRCGPTTEVVVASQAIVGRLVVQGPDFVYVNGGPASAGLVPSEIRRVERAGAPSATVVRAATAVHTAGATYQVVAVNGPALAWQERQTLTTFQYAPVGTTATSFPAPAGTFVNPSMTSLAGAIYVGFWESAGTPQAFVMDGVQTTVSTANATRLPGPVPDIVIDPVKNEYFGVSDQVTVVRFGLSPTMNAAVQIGWLTMTSLQSDLALGGSPPMLYFASGVSPKGIVRLDPASLTGASTAPLLAWLPNVVPQTMASDGSFLYYIAGTSLYRVDLASSLVTAELITTTGVKATGLVVDDQCVYWVESGSTIMKRAKQ
jgi:hypothetical protein